jgi:hypothetical protein
LTIPKHLCYSDYAIQIADKGTMIMAIGERIHFIRNLRGMTQKLAPHGLALNKFV